MFGRVAKQSVERERLAERGARLLTVDLCLRESRVEPGAWQARYFAAVLTRAQDNRDSFVMSLGIPSR